MASRRRIARWLGAAAVVGSLIGGCAQESPAPVINPTSASMVTPPPVPGATTAAITTTMVASTTTAFRPVEIVDDVREWATLGTSLLDAEPPSDFDGQVLVFDRRGAEYQGQALWAYDGTRAYELHRTPPSWIINDAWVDDGRVALLEYEDRTGEYRLWVFDLRSGSGTVIEKRTEPAGPPAVVPLMHLNGSWLVWFTDAPEGDRLCVRVRNLDTGEVLDAHCADDPSIAFGPPRIDWPIVAFTETADGSSNESCGSLDVVHLPDGKLTRYEARHCGVFDGAASGKTIAWTDQPAPFRNEAGESGVDYWDVPVFGVEDGDVVGLGHGVAGSVMACDGIAYWLYGGGKDSSEIRAWQPGGPVRTIYRTPDEGFGRRYALTRPGCHGDVVTAEQAGWQADAPEEFLVMGDTPSGWTVFTSVPPTTAFEATPDTYIQEVRVAQTAESWSADLSDQDLVDLAKGVCANLERQPSPGDMQQVFFSTEGPRVMTQTGMTEPEFNSWARIAFRSYCPAALVVFEQ